MILQFLRLRDKPSKHQTAPNTGTLDLVNRDDRPFVRIPGDNEAGLLAEPGGAATNYNSRARIDSLAVGGVCINGEVFTLGNHAFEFNASDGTTVSNPTAIPVKAQGTITLTANPADAGTMNIGVDAAGVAFQYRFKTTPVQAKDIKIGSTVDETVEYIIAAINGTDGGFNTVANNSVTAANGTGTTVVVTAKYHGGSGDAVAFTESATNLTMDGSNTLGGTRAGVNQKYVAINISSI